MVFVKYLNELGYDLLLIDNNIEIITEGVYFDVIILNNVVIKILKNQLNNFDELFNIIEMVEIQNHLAKHMDEVFPAYVFKNYIITDKVPGIRCDKIKDKRFEETFLNKIQELKTVIRKLGVEIIDITRHNLFFDDNKFYMVDFSGVRYLTNK